MTIVARTPSAATRASARQAKDYISMESHAFVSLQKQNLKNFNACQAGTKKQR